MRSGDRILGYAEIKTELTPSGELKRWSARDTRSGETLIVVSPGSMARLRPGAEDRFRAAHESRPIHPGVLGTQGCDVTDGQIHGALPEHEPYPNLPLEPEQALALLKWLIPAVLSCGTALGGELDASDLVQLDDGQIRLSPSGIMRDRSLARLPHHLAPEIDPEKFSQSADAALYGLGVLFFEAVTGQKPVQARTLDQLRAGQKAPRQASALQPQIGPELDAILTNLLHMDPAKRRDSVTNMPPPGESPRISRVHRQARVESGSPSQIARTYTRESMSIRKWTLLLEPPAPNRAALRRIAGCSGLFAGRVKEALDAGLSVPLGSFDTEAEANGLLQLLDEDDASVSVVYTGHRSGPAWVLAGSTVGGMGLGGTVIIGLATWGAPVAVGLGLCMVSGGLAGVRGWLQSRRLKSIQAGMRVGHGKVQLPEALGALREVLGEARRAVHSSDIPELIELELGASLDALEDELEELAKLKSSELAREPARGRLDRADIAARAVRDAAESVVGAESSDAASIAIRRAAAASKALTYP